MSNDSLLLSFRHRENEDGSWDSICMRCYLTAAHSYAEQQLHSVESGHHCGETSWLFDCDRESSLPTISRTALTVRLGPPARECPPSAMPRLSRQPDAINSSRQTHIGRHSGLPAGLREQAPSERRGGF
jgi:hypothetical protein